VEKMLKSAGYTDMGVIDELRNGTDLVGCVERTEFWPTKFQPASVTLEKSYDMASKERGGLHQQFVGVCEGDFIEQVWNKTMEEVTLVFWLVLSRLTFEPEVRHSARLESQVHRWFSLDPPPTNFRSKWICFNACVCGVR